MFSFAGIILVAQHLVSYHGGVAPQAGEGGEGRRGLGGVEGHSRAHRSLRQENEHANKLGQTSNLVQRNVSKTVIRISRALVIRRVFL